MSDPSPSDSKLSDKSTQKSLGTVIVEKFVAVEGNLERFNTDIDRICNDLETLKSHKTSEEGGDVRGLLIYVLAPSIIGGAGKISLEMINPASLKSNVILRDAMQAHTPELTNSQFLGLYSLFNIILAVTVGFLGTVLIGEIPNRKNTSRWKTAGLALSYALFFPLALNTISDNLFLSNKLKDLESTAVETLNEIGDSANTDTEVQIKIVESAEKLAQESDNHGTKKDVIRFYENDILFPQNSITTPVKERAIRAIENIINSTPSSDGSEIQSQVVAILDRLLNSETIDPSLKVQANALKDSIQPKPEKTSTPNHSPSKANNTNN
ncbi:MAG: hypothetical protein AAF572_24420 [Cyanobacteria bacterium P01_B01_bin.77]